MTKRISQANTVVVPVAEAHVADGKAVATKPVVVPADAEVVAVKAEAEEGDKVVATVIAEPVAALVAPAPMAMVAEPVAAAEPAAASAAAAVQSDDDGTDLTPFIVGGVLLGGAILAVALSSGDTDPIPVTPTPTNTAPRFTSTATATIAENAPIATIVYDANVSDTENNTIVFTLGGADASFFNIDSATGVVTLKASANFEAKSSYAITITATDNGTPSMNATQAVTVTVTNVNEAPAFTSATASATVDENIATSTVVFTASAPDPDAVGQTAPLPAGSVVTYSISGTDAGAFNINAANGQVTFKASPDFETKSSYTFTVTATDNGSPALSSTQTVTINVRDLPEGPVFTSGATATIAENSATSTVVYDANATGATSFALSGADAAAFNFDTTTGIVTFKASPDFETKATYNITISATGATGTSTQAVVVSVTNVNEAPTFAAATRTTTVAENTTGTLFAAGGATDPDAGATLTYTITGADASFFSVNAQTGAVSFVNSPNFEAARSPTYTFNLVATDQGGLTATQVNTVTVTNVNEAPVFAGGATLTVSIPENTTAVTAAGGATDPDANTALTYTITGADAALFTVNAQTGALAFRAAPDFETPRSAANSNAYSLNLLVSDGAITTTQAVTVNVTDVAVEGTRIDGAGIPAGSNTSFDAAAGNIVYLESGSVGNLTTINNFTTGDIIRTDVATSNYSFSSFGTTLIVSYNNNGIVSEIQLPNTVRADATIFNEASAEAAVGFDFFQSSIAPPPAASGSLDAAGSASTSYNAGTASNTYTDNVAQANTSIINNFTSDDRVVMTGINGATAATSASFSSFGTDLIITFNNNGIVSQITITGVVSPTATIFNEASAEAAIGFDFFRYG